MSKVKQKQELRKLFPCHKQIYIVTSHILTGYNNKKKKDNPKRLHIIGLSFGLKEQSSNMIAVKMQCLRIFAAKFTYAR